jgi:AraC-like DNA-binding protein
VAVPAIHSSSHRSDLDWSELIWRDPDPRLRDHVRRYQGYVQGPTRTRRRRAVANGHVAVIMNFGSALALSDPRDPARRIEHRSAFVAGLHDSYTTYAWTGDTSGLQVDLTPIGAHAMFGMPLAQIVNRVIGLDDALGSRQAELLIDRLQGADGWPARFDLLEAAIAQRVAEARGPTPIVARAWSRLERSRGRVPVAALAAEVGSSHEHLSRQFRAEIGLTPKKLARIMRFGSAVQRASLNPAPPWAHIALDCGYFDQAHLIRDFREFAGSTPGQFLANRIPGGAGVSD